MEPADIDVADRLAGRTLELIDVPSESRAEDALAAHVAEVLRHGGLDVTDLGDSCVLATPRDGRRPRILLAGHLDTVPPQGNIPGRRDADRVHGLGASDMKGAVAVALELALAGQPYSVLVFPREELPVADSALTPLLERAFEAVVHELVLMMEPTDNQIHAGCLGNINATWTFSGRSGHSARPWDADNAIEHAAAGVLTLARREPVEHVYDDLRFVEVASVTRIEGGIAGNVIPDRARCHVNFRYAPGRSPEEAEARLAELCEGHGSLRIDSNAPSGAVAAGHPLVQALVGIGGLDVLPKQAWTPVAEFAAKGIPAVNFGPGAPAQAHRRDESVEVTALVRSYRLLERLAAAV